MKKSKNQSDRGFVIPYSLIIASVVIVLAVIVYYAVRSFSHNSAIPDVAAQPAVDPALVARLAQAKAALESQTAALDRMLVESQAQSRYGVVYEDGYVAANAAVNAADALFKDAKTAQASINIPNANKTILAINTKYRAMLAAIASWKAALVEYNNSSIDIGDLGTIVQKDADDIKQYIQQLNGIVSGLTPDNSGLTPDQIDAYKKSIADAVADANNIVDPVAPSQTPPDGNGPGGPAGNGAPPVTQQDINAQEDVVKQDQAKADDAQKQIDDASTTPPDNSGGSNPNQNPPDQNSDQNNGQNSVGSNPQDPGDQGDQSDQSYDTGNDNNSGPKLIEGANRY